MYDIKISILLLLAAIISSGAQLILKLVVAHSFRKEIFWTASSIFLFSLSTLIFTYVLKFLPLGEAIPLISLIYILVPAGGIIFFGEKVRKGFWAGALLICFGIWLTVPQ